LLISLFLVPTKLGLYVIAVTLTSATSLVGSSVSLVALPLVARLEGGNHRFEVARHLILVTVGAALAVTVPMVAFAPELLHVFFGRSYVPAANVARVLLVGGVILSTNRTLGALLKGLGRPLDAGMAEFVALGFTIVGLAALLPMLGLMGAAIASVVAYGVSSAWMMRRAARALEVPLVELVRIRRNDLVAIRELLSALHVAAQRRGARTAAPRGSDTVA
jgi:O-antigen/teichoic acid export membrane protein